MPSHSAWISGGGGALGVAFARALLDDGAGGVTLADSDAAAGAAAVAALRSAAVRFDRCDVTDAAAVRRSLAAAAAAHGGRLSVVVNNAGTADESDVAGHFRLNAVAVVEATRAALRVMRPLCGERDPGVVVNVASAAGVFPLQGAPVYTASKHAVVGFTRCFAFSNAAPANVKVCALAPGTFRAGRPRPLPSAPECAGPVSDTALWLRRSFLSLACSDAAGFTQSPMLDRTFRTEAEKRRLLDSVGVMEPSEVAAALLRIVTDASVASGSCTYLSASTGVFDPFANQMQLWKAAVQAHRRTGSRRARL